MIGSVIIVCVWKNDYDKNTMIGSVIIIFIGKFRKSKRDEKESGGGKEGE